MKTTAVMFALPGTSSDEAAATFRHIDELFGRRFGNMRRIWAYTSSGVRRKLERDNKPVPDPGAALSALLQDGITHVAVKSLHFADGMEYKELKELAQARRKEFREIVVSSPLLDATADIERTIRCILAALPSGTADSRDALLLVAHGSLQPEAQAAYVATAELCRRLDQRVILGALMCDPGLNAVIRECKSGGIKKLVVAPMMMAAGFSARNEIAGSNTQSWVSALKREGIDCMPVFKGLGDYEEVVRMWFDDIERMLTRLAENT